MSTKEKLTIQELELLSQAYIDSSLSIIQERDLEIVLLFSDISSPIIDEARELMGLTTRMAVLSANESKRKKRVRLCFLKYTAIAAAIGIVAIISIGHFSRTTTAKDYPEIYVCVDGEVMSGEKAQTIVSETEDLSMAMLKSVIEEAENDQRFCTEYMNSIIH